MGQYNFSGQRDRSFFIVLGQNLAKGRDGPEKLKSGTGWAGTAKIRDGTRDKTGQSRKGRSKTGKRCSKTENDVLKQEKDVLKQEKDVLKQKI